MSSEFVIYVRGLRKSYGEFEAVKGIDFEVRPGEVFGLLGPNGAGKTTTVEILEGLRPRSAGEVKVLDFDPERQKKKLKDRIGACLQATNLPDKITVREALDFFGSFTRAKRMSTRCSNGCNSRKRETPVMRHYQADKNNVSPSHSP